jgi:hypothetical protein
MLKKTIFSRLSAKEETSGKQNSSKRGNFRETKQQQQMSFL